MTTTKKFIYDIITSSLFDIHGHFLKKVFCPKAKNWNQLIADDPLDRSRGCQDCGERVVDLDKDRIGLLFREVGPCIYISPESTSVIFLEYKNALKEFTTVSADKQGVVIIKTVRTIDDINRAANMGYWPDVRIINYKDRELPSDLDSKIKNKTEDLNKTRAEKPIRAKFAIDQNTQTGQIDLKTDFRNIDDDKRFKELIPFTYYYPHYQSIPIAAYLIPPNVEDGSEVVVEDPIEDIVSLLWNQGDIIRAKNVKGFVRARKIELDYLSVKPRRAMG